MDNRQRFEEWVADQLGHTVDFVKSQRAVNVDRYYNEYIEVNYQAWKAATEHVEVQVKQEAAQMKAIIDSVTDLGNEPHFHEQGMGCGLEDRGITDRYEAMRYGWDQAMERVYGEVIPCAEELSFPATDVFLSRLRAEGVEMAIEQCLSVDTVASTGAMKYVLQGFAQLLREGKHGEVVSD